MKMYLLAVIALIILTGISCKKPIDIEKEKAAIIAVIEEETEAFFDSDINRLSATHVQDDTNIRLTATKSGYTCTIGWENVKAFFLEYFENEAEPGDFYEVKTNYKIKVYTESAWAVFDNDYYNGEGELLSKSIHTEFLEKVNGEWKLVLYNSIYTSTWDEDINNETKENKRDGV